MSLSTIKMDIKFLSWNFMNAQLNAVFEEPAHLCLTKQAACYTHRNRAGEENMRQTRSGANHILVLQ